MRKLLYISKVGARIEAEVADSFLSRFCGLMLRKKIPLGQGLLITKCNSIHMNFMRFSIDAVYFSSGGEVLKIVKNLRPWMGLSRCGKADSVLELPAGGADAFGFSVGDLPRVRDI